MRKVRLLGVSIILLVIIIIISQLFLPPFAADKLRDVFEQETDSIDKLEINIASFPALKILIGRVDHVFIESDGLQLDHLYLDSFDVSYRDIVLQKGSFYGINTYLEAVISEKAIDEYISATYPELNDFQLKITPEQVLLEGSINFFEAIFNLKLSGNFVINDQEDIYFVPDDLQVENIKIPVNLLKSYVEKVDFSFNLDELGIPLDISELKLMSGYIIISGGVLEKGSE